MVSSFFSPSFESITVDVDVDVEVDGEVDEHSVSSHCHSDKYSPTK